MKKNYPNDSFLTTPQTNLERVPFHKEHNKGSDEDHGAEYQDADEVGCAQKTIGPRTVESVPAQVFAVEECGVGLKRRLDENFNTC